MPDKGLESTVEGLKKDLNACRTNAKPIPFRIASLVRKEFEEELRRLADKVAVGTVIMTLGAILAAHKNAEKRAIEKFQSEVPENKDNGESHESRDKVGPLWGP